MRPLLQAEEWMQMGREVAIATVIDTWKSSPNPIGSQLIIDETGAFLGAVSGGCIDSAVVLKARDVIVNGEPRMLKFSVSDEVARGAGLFCGGDIQIYLERVG